MIASKLNRNGLRRSLLITTRNQSTVVLLRLPRASPLFVSSGARSSSIVPASRCLGIRALSSNPPPTDKTASEHAPDAVTPTSSRKPKVDLRPGPVKPQRPTSSTAALPNAASSSAPSSKGSHPTTSSSSTSTSLIEATKRDYEAASQHGILAPPPKDASWAGSLFHQAKELFKFYWRGVKLVNTNRIRAREMQERVKNGGPPLTRWETRFIRTYKDDIVKLVPFAMIFIVIEEIIPLIVLYAPFLLPSTCILPSQKERIDDKRRAQQRTYMEGMADDFHEIYRRATADNSLSTDALLAGSTTPLSLTGVLGLSTFAPRPIRIRRVKRHLNFISEDDALLIRENGILSLSEADLRDALEERGLLTEGYSTKQLQSRLSWWLDQVKRSNASAPADADAVRERIVLLARAVIGKF
ncbi:unnamed protein product [Somion occarium]|uniref:Letm1 RBD domain-containing protein n=1 Tax=Somion occarium TaxID=3059160 RepID=A0ABP1DJI4_9APHY